MKAESVADLRVRGHHLLCMLGFRGEGYSDPFIANMRRVVAAFSAEPPPLVQLLAEPDDICVPCPYLSDGACTAEDGADEKTRTMDTAVLDVLGLRAGTLANPEVLLALLRQRMDPEKQACICAGCRWLPKGFCAAGLAKLRRK